MMHLFAELALTKARFVALQHCLVWVKPTIREDHATTAFFQVTEADFTYVAIDETGKKRPIPAA